MGTTVLLLIGPTRASGQCQRAKLTADDGEPDDWFGYAAGFSGDLAVIGAHHHDHFGYNYGAAYIFERSGAAWGQVAEIAPQDDGGFVGQSVAIDGELVVLGAKTAWTSVFERCAGAWTQVGQLRPDDYSSGCLFGHAVALSGVLALVGAPHDDDNGWRSGSAYVFERDPNGLWFQDAKLLADDGEPYDRFGAAVGISGDVTVIGAYYDRDLGDYSGSAYVFERDPNGVWVQAGKLLASDGGPMWSFGESVAVSGERVIVGATTAQVFAPNGGAAYIYERDPNGVWVETAQLVSNDIANSDFFGIAVALDGDIAIVGAENADYNATDSGAAYVFVRQPDATWPQVAKIGASDGRFDDRFGSSVAVSANTAVVGAYQDDDHGTDSGSAYVFAVGPDDDGDGIMDVCLCPGDLDGDYDVDLADLAQLLANYGTTSGAQPEDGDLDSDGDVDLADLAALLAEYGTICP